MSVLKFGASLCVLDHLHHHIIQVQGYLTQSAGQGPDLKHGLAAECPTLWIDVQVKWAWTDFQAKFE